MHWGHHGVCQILWDQVLMKRLGLLDWGDAGCNLSLTMVTSFFPIAVIIMA